MFVCSRLDTMMSKRKQLLISLVNMSHQVTMVSMERHFETEAELRSLGICFRHTPCRRNRLSLVSDLVFIYQLIGSMSESKPDVVVSYTIKPNVYSGIALKFYKKSKFFPVVTGLGYAFQEAGLSRKVLRLLTVWLHRFSFSRAERIIVQNTHNRQYLIDYGIAQKGCTIVIEGDGVNLPGGLEKRFSSKLRFVTLSRLLGEKGLRELNKAVAELKKDYPDFHIELFGPKETSPDAISSEELDQWKIKRTLVWQGYCDDIDQLLRSSDVLVLPSYHEGMSTAVCEGIAYGLPVVGTDIPGIQEMVEENGYLVPPRQVTPLVNALRRLLEATHDELRAMSDRSRDIAVRKFDREKVMKRIEKVIT